MPITGIQSNRLMCSYSSTDGCCRLQRQGSVFNSREHKAINRITLACRLQPLLVPTHLHANITAADLCYRFTIHLWLIEDGCAFKHGCFSEAENQ